MYLMFLILIYKYMENLKDFKSYSINEKIGWKEILVSLIVIFGTRNNPTRTIV
jgi:hypothetical protein